MQGEPINTVDSALIADINELIEARNFLGESARKNFYNFRMSTREYDEIASKLSAVEEAIKQKIYERFPNIEKTDNKKGLLRGKLRLTS